MGFDNTTTFVGNVTRDPELRFTKEGTALVSFGVAWNQKKKNGDSEGHFFDCTAWDTLAENIAETVQKGDRVVVYGRLNFSTWTSNDGDKRSKIDVSVEDCGPSLRWASAVTTKNERNEQGGNRGQGSGRTGAGPKPEEIPDEEPF